MLYFLMEDNVGTTNESDNMQVNNPDHEMPVDDNDEEDKEVSMTSEELLDYMMLLLDKYKVKPETNILISLNNELLEQQNMMKDKIEEAEKMQKFFSLLMRDQEKYFRHVGALSKLETWDVGVQVMLPIAGSRPLCDTDIPEMKKEKQLPNTPTKQTPVLPAKPSAGTNEVKAAEVLKASNAAKSSVEIIDLTDEQDTATSRVPQTGANSRPQMPSSNSPKTSMPMSNVPQLVIKHPAPLPYRPSFTVNKNIPGLPPKPTLRISSEKHGIVLQWNLSLIQQQHARIKSYEIFGYQESKTGPVNSSLWKKIGDVKALVLPMACTLTQFVEGFRYHFAIRAVDEFLRPGPYSDPASIVYQPNAARV